jgi:NADH oxidase (H2O2-forming)
MKFCIVGGGGGASNAANVIRQLDREALIDIFTDRDEIGNQPCEIPFVLKGDLARWDQTFVFKGNFYAERNVNVHLDTAVTEIVGPERRLVANGVTHEYDRLILDLGSIPNIPAISGLDGQNEYVLSTNLNTARPLLEAITKNSDAAIVGVGQIGLEIAAALKARGYRSIHLLGRSDRVLRAYLDEDFAAKLETRISDSGVDLMLSTAVSSVANRDGTKVVSFSNKEIRVDFLVFAAGSRPNSGVAREARLAIGQTGAIAVNEYLQTSDPAIYAIGDCAETRDAILGVPRLYQTATNAARGGRLAATNAVLGNVLPLAGTTSPFIMEAFGYQVGTVGFSEREAREKGLDVRSNTITTATRRRAFGGKTIHIKLIADRGTRALVGAQILSEELVAGKIDRLSLAIAERVPVDRLAVVDTCYSPTVGSAYEPLVMAFDQLRLKLDG